MMEFSYYYGNQADQFSFIRIPRVLLVDQLFSPLSIQSKILYGVLLDRMGISMRNGWFDELNRVYIIYQISEIQEDLGFSKKKAIDYLTELEQFGLVEKKRRGRGLPSILYVKSFMTRDAISRSVETGTSEPIISSDAVEHDMNVNIACVAVTIRMSAYKHLMTWKIVSGKCHSEFLSSIRS